MKRSFRPLASLAALLVLLGACTEPEPKAPPAGVTAEVTIEGQPEDAPEAITHGNDYLPPRPRGLFAQTPAMAGWPCEGSGTEGRRVQLVYAHGGNGNLSGVRPTLESFTQQIQGIFLESARATGGERLVRMVTDAECALSILDVRLTSNGIASFDQSIAEMRQQGLADDNRVYLAYVEAQTFCGIGTVYSDTRQVGNWNDRLAQYSRVDRPCWDASTGAHELLHNLGAVQNEAPNSTGGLHCRDEFDVMCYPDGAPNGTMIQVCPVEQEARLDCGRNDYFTTAAPTGYLASNWNSAEAATLVRSVTGPTPPTLPPPPPDTTLPPTTTTTTIAGQAPTSTELVVPRSIRNGEAFQAIAQVSANDPGGPCTPSGVAQFYVSGKLISGQVLDANGTATATLTITGEVSRPTIRAEYLGSPTCRPSDAKVRRRVR